jgi:hypothetical protein
MHGRSRDQTVCIQVHDGHDRLQGQQGLGLACNGATVLDPENIIILSPNKNNEGGGFYCGIVAT